MRPIPLLTSPLKGEEASLPFRGRGRVGVGWTVLVIWKLKIGVCDLGFRKENG